jgi:hypothetical protein
MLIIIPRLMVVELRRLIITITLAEMLRLVLEVWEPLALQNSKFVVFGDRVMLTGLVSTASTRMSNQLELDSVQLVSALLLVPESDPPNHTTTLLPLDQLQTPLVPTAKTG